MRTINKIDISNITYYIQDDIDLYLFIDNPSNALSVFNIPEFKMIESFSIKVPLNNNSRPCVDNDCIYLSTQEGQILGIDKFSGKLLITLDLGLMLPVCDIGQDMDAIYSICVTPIMQGIQKENLLVLCINNKETGKKQFQSSFLDGKTAKLNIDANVTFTVDKILYLYSKNGHKVKSIKLNFIPDYPIVTTDNFIVCACKSGTLEIFNKKTHESNNLFVAKNNIQPIVLQEDIIYWLTDKYLYRIDLQKSLIDKLLRLNKTPEIECAIHNNFLYYVHEHSLIKCNLSSESLDDFDIKEKIIHKPIIYKDDVLLISQHHIYQVGD